MTMNVGQKMAASCLVALAAADLSRGQTATDEPQTYLKKEILKKAAAWFAQETDSKRIKDSSS
jgi:hypothetical protein